MLEYFILFFFNTYIIFILGVPIDTFINLMIIVKAIINLTSNEKRYKLNKVIFVLLLMYLLSISITFFTTGNYYYIFQFIRNLFFVIALYATFQTVNIEKSIIPLIIVYSFNNLVILFQMLGFKFVYKIVKLFSNISDVALRFDYRASGVANGPLKASILSFFMFFYALYFMKNKTIRVILLGFSLIFAFIESRSAVLLIVICLIIYIIGNLAIGFNNYNEYKLKKKSIFSSIVILIAFVMMIKYSFMFLDSNFRDFKSTISWQMNGLFNIGSSHSSNILINSTKTELNRFFQLEENILFGWGISNFKGAGSIQTDNGFVVEIIGLGIVGFTILLLINILIFVIVYKNVKSDFKSVLATITTFVFHIFMNLKSTSFLGFSYFNVTLIMLFLVFYEHRLSLVNKVDI